MRRTGETGESSETGGPSIRDTLDPHSPSLSQGFCFTPGPRLTVERKCQVTAVSPLSLEGPDLRSTGDPARSSAAPFGDAAPFPFSRWTPLPYSCPYLSLSSVGRGPRVSRYPVLIRMPGATQGGCCSVSPGKRSRR